MSDDRSSRSDSSDAHREAAAWVTRVDRGLTAAEQDDYLQWLRENPDRVAMIAEHEASLRRLMRLSAWQPGAGSDPNPDLLAPARRWPRLAIPMAAAAALALALTYWAGWHVPNRAQSHLVVDEQRTLPDGSRVEFKNGSAVEIRYSPTERRVKLMGGEAMFTVQKDPSRPFIVEAAGVTVQAVGTVFDVRLDPASVAVTVTQGKVQVGEAARRAQPVQAAAGPVFVSAGESTAVPLAGAELPPQVARLSRDQLDEELAWQTPRFQFYETRLDEAVAEFNRYNRQRLVIGDSKLGSVLIGGSFRADDVAGFARVLEAVIGARSAPGAAGEIVLTGGARN